MKFDFVIGNPPYQEENINNNRQAPIYHIFMDEAYKIATVTELITPARFLFEAGQTPKAWNKKMLSDPHLKVVMYEPDSSVVFSNTDIKGGVAITLRDALKNYGAIEVFVDEPALQSIVNSVVAVANGFISEMAYSKSSYNLTHDLYLDFPELKDRLTIGNEYIIDANIFKKMPEIFSEIALSGTIKVYGREDGKRVCKWIDSKYIRNCTGLSKYKIFVTGANGRGELGEVLSSPFVGEPYSIGTQTYMSFGWFDIQEDADACLKYLKTKFARCLLGVLKKTQNNPREVWSKIPLQDFTSASDIDWTKSIPEIDQQLYKKYGLDETEIQFIETHVKEMA